MFPSNAGTALSFSKVIGGISKTLGIVNQAIPIYKEVKPVVGKATGLYSIVKEFKNTPTIQKNTENVKKTVTHEVPQTQKKKISSSNSPIFFQ